MEQADFLIIGGGIAGLSAGARLAAHGRTIVLEAEEAVGYHSSGRSVTFSHFGIGNRTVRGLTSYSRDFFLHPPDRFDPLSRALPALFVSREESLAQLEALHSEMALFTDTVERVGEDGMSALCPILRTGEGQLVAGIVDRGGLKLDPHALLQGFARAVRTTRGEIVTGVRVGAIRRSGEAWEVEADSGRFAAPVLINAAGAWADGIAALAAVRPLGLTPLRRTIIVLDPQGHDVKAWPFVKSVRDEFYMMPESGMLLASPVDEVADDPCDAQPDEYDVALAASRVEEYTTLAVTRIAHRWAGLRTFTSDRVPTAGFAEDAPGFFWLAGQGGYGLQTAPAMAEITEALVLGRDWPAGLADLGVEPRHVTPERLASGFVP
jgi:D-arginine dehydrogenase